MGTLRPVLESIFPVFDGGNTATLARGQANIVFRDIFIPGYTDILGEKIRTMSDLDTATDTVT